MSETIKLSRWTKADISENGVVVENADGDRVGMSGENLTQLFDEYIETCYGEA